MSPSDGSFVRPRRVLRTVGFGALGVVLLLGVVLAAWLASNLFDSKPSPRPPELSLAVEQLPSERNDFYALVALLQADPGPDLQRAGRDEWARLQRPDANQPTAVHLPRPSGPPFVCPGQADCGQHWRAHTLELAAQLAGHAELSQRCVAVAADFEFVEVLPPVLTAAAPMASHGVAAATCSRWLGARAVVAWSQGDQAAALRDLVAADRMARKLLAGSRTLIGQAIAWRLARGSWQLVYMLGASDPAFAAQSAALLRPLSEAESTPARWTASEAAFQHAIVDEMLAACAGGASALIPADDLGELPRWACRTQLGMLPNQTHADLDEAWLSRRAVARSHASLREALDHRKTAGSEVLSLTKYWRNSFSRILFDVGSPLYLDYLAREIDVDLHREALALALDAVVQQVPAAERPRWIMDRAQRSDLLRNRTVLEGRTLGVRTWQETAGRPNERDAIRIEL